MADQITESCTLRHPQSLRVCIRGGDPLIADTRKAIELRKRSYQHRQYLAKAYESRAGTNYMCSSKQIFLTSR
ncbi:hypothetical protein [Halomonas sp. B23F22_10]|uniref:hypothetical protein n=1 Tax=Halomonas sp. B23F22_10 TaxID=3459515 RepID=UPI00373EC6E7